MELGGGVLCPCNAGWALYMLWMGGGCIALLHRRQAGRGGELYILALCYVWAARGLYVPAQPGSSGSSGLGALAQLQNLADLCVKSIKKLNILV